MMANVIFAQMLPRRLLSRVEYLLEGNAAVAILGPRQVGKTTLARQISAGRPSIYLDLQNSEDVAKLSNPASFLAAHFDKLVVLDEIQRRPQLFPELRGLIDQSRRQGKGTGRYLILGSASHDLLRQSSESLAGRIVFTELSPLAADEVAADEMERLWVKGGFPESFMAPTEERSMDWRRSFIRSYLERDVRDFAPGVSPQTLERFWTMLAYAQGGQWNGAKLAAGLGVSGQAVARYRDLLTDLLLVRQLPPWSGNVRKRLVKAPKVYIRDSGICHALVKVIDRDSLLGHPVVGGSWEGFVIDNILGVVGDNALTSFYRSASGDEIDLVLEIGSRCIAIDAKRSLAPTVDKSFYRACESIGADQAWLVYPGADEFEIDKGVKVVGLPRILNLLRESAGGGTRR